MAIHPLKQMCGNLINQQRVTLDNFEQLVAAWPDDWKATGTTVATPGGARGVTPKRRTGGTRHRAGGGRGVLGGQARNIGSPATNR